MRRWIVLGIATLALVLTLPAARITAACEPLPPAGSADGIKIMRTTEFIVTGTIDDAVPTDAHGGFTFFLNVRGYFRGAGPARIEVSDYGDGDAPASASDPGSALAASRTFVGKYAGQDALIFAYEEDPPYTGQFAINGCTYTAYGDASSADILPFVTKEFGAPQPPALAGTGQEGLATLVLAAAALLAAGAALRGGGWTKLMVQRARPR